MNMMTLETLNSEFSIADHLSFIAGPGGLLVAEIANAHGTASISLYGAHVLSYQPHGQPPVIFRSAKSNYEIGKPIRGGVPVCWPWFGPHPDEGKPLHGFARISMWSVVATGVTASGAIQITFGISSTEATRAIWEHDFNLKLILTLDNELKIELDAENCGDKPFICSGALHSYFSVGDISDISIEGFEGITYLDRLVGEEKTQLGAIKFNGEKDSAYLNTINDVSIVDSKLARKIAVSKSGSRTTVVWNPGETKAKKIPDLGDGQYTEMVCVEPANVSFPDLAKINIDPVTLAPGQSHRLSTTIRTETLTKPS